MKHGGKECVLFIKDYLGILLGYFIHDDNKDKVFTRLSVCLQFIVLVTVSIIHRFSLQTGPVSFTSKG